MTSRTRRPRTPWAISHPLLALAAALAACGWGAPAMAAEGYRLRQTPLSVLGGEIAATPENPGFFGTASLSRSRIDRITDGGGDDLTLAGRTVPLPTGTPTGGRVADGSYALVVPAAAVGFHQTQEQLNLVGGFVTADTYAGGRWVFAANLPLLHQRRRFTATAGDGVVTPTPPASLPAPLRAAINGVATAANAQVQAALATTVAAQNQEVSGAGDLELSTVWVRHHGPLRLALGLTAFLPTGVYDAGRGPNPGFGKFYTLRPSAGVTYAFDDPASPAAGVTLAGRVGLGFNTRNRDTDYRSGNFLTFEGAAVKVLGNWGLGLNLIGIQQFTDDTGTGAPADGRRYRNFAAGPFLAWKFPGSDAGLNLHWSRNFASRNALVSETLQLRFVRVW